jgi:hypothetical protein
MNLNVNEIEKILECPICLDILKEPKLLSCQHTFCLSPCLENIIENNEIKCPECRKIHSLSVQGVADLKTNITIQRILNSSLTDNNKNKSEESSILSTKTDLDSICASSDCSSDSLSPIKVVFV